MECLSHALCKPSPTISSEDFLKIWYLFLYLETHKLVSLLSTRPFFPSLMKKSNRYRQVMCYVLKSLYEESLPFVLKFTLNFFLCFPALEETVVRNPPSSLSHSRIYRPLFTSLQSSPFLSPLSHAIPGNYSKL